jgi:hypothetical protein
MCHVNHGPWQPVALALAETKELFAIRKRGSLSEAALIPGWVLIGEHSK